MHGRDKFSLSDAEREKLKTYLERGGTLFADALCSREAFANSFRQEMAAIFPDKPLERITASDVLFTHKFGGFELKTVSRRNAPSSRPKVRRNSKRTKSSRSSKCSRSEIAMR